MIITEDFVFLHLPKTGGTFCTAHIERLYRQDLRQRLGNLLRRRPVHRFQSPENKQHYGIHWIPSQARSLPILGSVRLPYDRWVSHFEYKVYKRNPEVVPKYDLIMQAFPHFPEVTFTEFVAIVNRFFTKLQIELGKNDAEKLGFYSAQFIRMFCPDARDILARPRAEITADLVRSHLPNDITFLETGDLSRQLHRFLVQFNHDEAALQAILDSPKILPEKSGAGSLRSEGGWRRYYTKEALDMVNDKERLLFDLFPMFERVYELHRSGDAASDPPR